MCNNRIIIILIFITSIFTTHNLSKKRSLNSKVSWTWKMLYCEKAITLIRRFELVTLGFFWQISNFEYVLDICLGMMIGGTIEKVKAVAGKDVKKIIVALQ